MSLFSACADDWRKYKVDRENDDDEGNPNRILNRQVRRSAQRARDLARAGAAVHVPHTVLFSALRTAQQSASASSDRSGHEGDAGHEHAQTGPLNRQQPQLTIGHSHLLAPLSHRSLAGSNAHSILPPCSRTNSCCSAMCSPCLISHHTKSRLASLQSDFSLSTDSLDLANAREDIQKRRAMGWRINENSECRGERNGAAKTSGVEAAERSRAGSDGSLLLS